MKSARISNTGLPLPSTNLRNLDLQKMQLDISLFEIREIERASGSMCVVYFSLINEEDLIGADRERKVVEGKELTVEL
jgi:hypothetical protein